MYVDITLVARSSLKKSAACRRNYVSVTQHLTALRVGIGAATSLAGFPRTERSRCTKASPTVAEIHLCYTINLPWVPAVSQGYNLVRAHLDQFVILERGSYHYQFVKLFVSKQVREVRSLQHVTFDRQSTSDPRAHEPTWRSKDAVICSIYYITVVQEGSSTQQVHGYLPVIALTDERSWVRFSTHFLVNGVLHRPEQHQEHRSDDWV